MQVYAVGQAVLQVLQTVYLVSAGEERTRLSLFVLNLLKVKSQERVYRVVKDSANEIKLPKLFRDSSVKKAMRR